MVNYFLEKIKDDPKVNGKVCVLGLGYIGLPTSALLANRGYEVIGVDINEEVVNIINSGKIHIKEPGLDTFVHAAIESKRLKAYTNPKEADVFIVAVPTPFHKNGYDIPTPNIDYVISATKSIASCLQKGNMVILESTSPVGTTEKISQLLKELRPDLFIKEDASVFIAHCPERVLPGKVMRELVENDRIVGGINEVSSTKVANFYKTFVSGKVLITDSKTAELCKLVENSFRDVNIAFVNELSIICDKYGIDVWELRELANRHPRVNILYPGVGVGGHCIAVDPWFIVADTKEEAKLIRTAREVNNYKTEWVIEKIKNEALKFELENKRKPIIACMGLAFKPDIDDLRESPALYIAKRLTDELENVVCVEPNISINSIFNTHHSKLKLLSLEEALTTSELQVFLVAHKEFKNLIITGNKQVLDFCGVRKNASSHS